MLKDRISLYKQLEQYRNSKLLVYVTSDRQNAETIISTDIIAPFANHLDEIGDVEKISLLIYSNGGNILAGWSLVNLLRSFCKNLEVIVPFRCQSTATLIALGADSILMTKQGTLGPIDPSTNGWMNPQANINGQFVKVPVSVEHVNGFIEMAMNDLSIKDPSQLSSIFMKLTENIHPLSLGEVFRSKTQIKMLAEKLLKNYHKINPDNIPKVISFLCSESGSHDYTIFRREAKEDLGLNIEKPDDAQYAVIKAIYQDIENELELRSPFDMNIGLAAHNPYTYSLRRALIESISGGCDVFISEGAAIKHQNQVGQWLIEDNRTFEGWKHEKI